MISAMAKLLRCFDETVSAQIVEWARAQGYTIPAETQEEMVDMFGVGWWRSMRRKWRKTADESWGLSAMRTTAGCCPMERRGVLKFLPHRMKSMYTATAMELLTSVGYAEHQC